LLFYLITTIGFIPNLGQEEINFTIVQTSVQSGDEQVDTYSIL